MFAELMSDACKHVQNMTKQSINLRISKIDWLANNSMSCVLPKESLV